VPVNSYFRVESGARFGLVSLSVNGCPDLTAPVNQTDVGVAVRRPELVCFATKFNRAAVRDQFLQSFNKMR